MVLLHIAHIVNNECNGVCVVVPQHVRAQQNFATVGLLNITNVDVGVDNTLEYKEPFDLASLPNPFNSPDLVVFHEAYRAQYLKISKALVKRGIPYIIVPHGELSKHFQRIKWLKKKVANLLVFGKFIRRAKVIQCLSSGEAKETKFKNAQKIGANAVVLPSAFKQSFSENGIKLLYIGRLQMYHKGLDLMVRAVKNIDYFMRENGCKLCMYGPDYKGRFARLNKLINANGVEDIITLSPAIFGEEKEKIILDSDIFIQTSRAEGAPLGVLEALSYGLPCILTAGTNFAEFVEENDAGWACQTDAQSISAAIVKAVGERMRLMDKSQNAVAAIEKHYCWDVIAEETVEKYKFISCGDEMLIREKVD